MKRLTKWLFAGLALLGVAAYIPTFPPQIALDPREFGAKADVVEGFYQPATTAGNSCFVLAGASFKAPDVNKWIRVQFAGANELWLNAQITTVTDATHICTSIAPTQTIGAATATAMVMYGTDSGAAINAAFTAAAANNWSVMLQNGHYMTSIPLTCPIPNNSFGFNNNFIQVSALCQMAPGTEISAMAPMTSVITYGSDANDYSGYIRHGVVADGSIDGGFVAQYDQDFPCFEVLNRQRVETKDFLHAGVHVGSSSCPQTSASLRDDHNSNSRTASGVVITGCTGTTTYTCTTQWQHGFGNQGRTKHPVIAITSSNVPQLAKSFFSITVTSPTTFTLDNTNATGWPAFSGTALAYLSMPTMQLSLPISGVTNANPAVITVPSTANMATNDKELITDVSAGDLGMTTGTYASARKCVDGVYPITVVDGTHFSVPVDTTGCTAYTSGGWALYWLPITQLEAWLYEDTASDMNVTENEGYGFRVAYIANNGGYEGRYSGHVYNLGEQGELLAGAYLGGGNDVTKFHVDCPAKFGLIFWGPGNSGSFTEHCAGISVGLPIAPAFNSVVRLASNLAELPQGLGLSYVQPTFNLTGGYAIGDTGNTIIYTFSSAFPYLDGYNPFGSQIGFTEQSDIAFTQAPVNILSGGLAVSAGTLNGSGVSGNLLMGNDAFLYGYKTSQSAIDSGLQFSASGQGLSFYTANTFRGFLRSTGDLDILAPGYTANNVSGVSCSGAPTGSYAVTNGIVTHC